MTELDPTYSQPNRANEVYFVVIDEKQEILPIYRNNGNKVGLALVQSGSVEISLNMNLPHFVVISWSNYAPEVAEMEIMGLNFESMSARCSKI